jgi:hypothetical protein
MAGTTESARVRKGKNFSSDEDRQVCRSILHVSQDPIAGNGQRKEAFWERITTHYNRNKPIGGGERPSRSIETKWGTIKHDVAKFIGVHKQVSSCRESGSSPDDVLQNALELYKVKHPKQHSFVFLHCWLILKEVPRWMETPGERQRVVAKTPQNDATRRAPASASDSGDHGEGDGGHNEEEVGAASNPSSRTAATPRKRGRPIGQKAAKEDQRVAKQREGAIRAQARATADMAAANFKKAQVLQDQAALSLFTMPDDAHLPELLNSDGSTSSFDARRNSRGSVAASPWKSWRQQKRRRRRLG